MTIYEFMLDCEEHGVRLEVDVGGLVCFQNDRSSP